MYNASCLSPCGTASSVDLALTNIVTPVGDLCEGTTTPVVTIRNNGTDAVSSASIVYDIDGGAQSTFLWNGNLAPQASTNVSLNAISYAVGSHTFNAEVVLTGDEVASNNIRSSSFARLANQTYYADSDGDGYGDPNVTLQDCGAPNGYVTNNQDCDDSNSQLYPGAPCNDNDACTVNDFIGPDCNCTGTYLDSDGDGVCDSEDVCPGGDDNVDLDGNGVPDDCDCISATKTFNTNQLSHSGVGNNSVSIGFNVGSRNASFTISGIDAVTNGRPDTRYVDSVVVTYQDESHNEVVFGTYTGLGASAVQVDIRAVVNNLTVTLYDHFDGNSPGQSINLSDILICESDQPCPDEDQDGVCDQNDICPGGDDNIDVNGNGVPDACDGACLNEVSVDFEPSALNHSGPGVSSAAVNLPANARDVSFTINNLDARDRGKETSRFIEKISVYYDNGMMEKLPCQLSG